MKAKRKLIISVLIMSFVLLAAVATIAVTFALTQQNITTSLNIGYEVQDIDGSVYATYTIGDETNYLVPSAIDSDHVSADGNSLIFKAEDLGDAGTLEFPIEELEFTSANDNVVIQYTYSNTGDKHYIASMSFDAELKYENMKVEYSINGKDYSEDRYAVVVPANSSDKSYWIKISIDKKAKNASFTGDFNWLLEGCDEQAEAYVSLTAVDFVGNETGTYSASYNGSYLPGGELVIPSSVNGASVTTISASTASAEQKAQVTSVYIPDSVTTIGANAFKNYTNLESVTFEQNETAGSASVQAATGLTTIGYGAFRSCISLQEFIVPDTVTELDYYSFYGCAGLLKFTIGRNVTSIGKNAFDGCYRLCVIYNFSSATLSINDHRYPSSAKILKEETQQPIYTDANGFVFFESETGKYRLVNYVGDETDITIPTTYNGYPVTIIGQYAFYKKEITTATIPEGVGVSMYSFSNCSKLINVSLPNSMTSISNYVFYNCTSLIEIILPSNLKSIMSNAFMGCTSLANIVLPSTLTKIHDEAFKNCTNLTSLTIPNSVIEIRVGSFAGCSALTSVIFENTQGWYRSLSGHPTISSAALSNSTTAATYLTSTYASVGWARE